MNVEVHRSTTEPRALKNKRTSDKYIHQNKCKTLTGYQGIFLELSEPMRTLPLLGMHCKGSERGAVVFGRSATRTER